jgi:hypothetical protein
VCCIYISRALSRALNFSVFTSVFTSVSQSARTRICYDCGSPLPVNLGWALSVFALKRELRVRGLPLGGKKTVLADRLHQAVGTDRAPRPRRNREAVMTLERAAKVCRTKTLFSPIFALTQELTEKSRLERRRAVWNAMTTEEQEKAQAESVEGLRRFCLRPPPVPKSAPFKVTSSVFSSITLTALLCQRLPGTLAPGARVRLAAKRVDLYVAGQNDKKKTRSLQQRLVCIYREAISSSSPTSRNIEAQTQLELSPAKDSRRIEEPEKREECEEKRRDNPAEQWPSLAKHATDPRRRAVSWGEKMSKELAWWGQDTGLHDWNACDLCSCASVQNASPFNAAKKRVCNLEENYLLLVDLCARGQPNGFVSVVRFHTHSASHNHHSGTA